MRRESPLIVGGGPAGAAAAIALARDGLRPVVLERSAEPADAICGGFLSWSTARQLRALGIDPAALAAHPIDRVHLFSGNRSAEARLPQSCWSLSRKVLDAALLARAQADGAEIRRGVKVVGIEQGEAHLADGERIDASSLVLATGKHDLRGVGRGQPSDDPALGLRWRLKGKGRVRTMVEGAVELHLFPGGYAGLALQEDGSANLCMAIKRSVLSEAGGNPARLLELLAAANPALAARIEAAGGEPGAAQAVANVPYGWIAAQSLPGVARVGDQAAVIPSLAGEGIAIALASGVMAGRAIAEGVDAERFQRRLARRTRLPVGVAGAIARTASHPLAASAIVGAVGLVPAISRLAARASRIGAEPTYSMPPG